MMLYCRYIHIVLIIFFKLNYEIFRQAEIAVILITGSFTNMGVHYEPCGNTMNKLGVQMYKYVADQGGQRTIISE